MCDCFFIDFFILKDSGQQVDTYFLQFYTKTQKGYHKIWGAKGKFYIYIVHVFKYIWNMGQAIWATHTYKQCSESSPSSLFDATSAPLQVVEVCES